HQPAPRERNRTQMPPKRKSMDRPEQVEGLHITGTVTGRTRRTIKSDNSSERVKVTYRVMVKGTILNVDHWQPESFYAVGELVTLPVYVRAFNNRRGIALYSLTIDDGKGASDGEEF